MIERLPTRGPLGTAVKRPATRKGNTLPTFDERLAELAAAERADGWLVACEEAGRFLVPCKELIAALRDVSRSLQAERILEICSGSGELAASLAATGLAVVATDSAPVSNSAVERIEAGEALRRYQPSVVLGSFVPVDAGVDEAVLAFPSVKHYVLLGARLGGMFGSPALWRTPGWTAAPLENVTRRMLTRHDVWLGRPEQPLLRHGEAWLVSRQ
ncbi:MAG: hypothetical protein GXY83_13640 [Rhodopirellula sp.]|nr:hypothetical protein [Rhodopirellula sp.]